MSRKALMPHPRVSLYSSSSSNERSTGDGEISEEATAKVRPVELYHTYYVCERIHSIGAVVEYSLCVNYCPCIMCCLSPSMSIYAMLLCIHIVYTICVCVCRSLKLVQVSQLQFLKKESLDSL